MQGTLMTQHEADIVVLQTADSASEYRQMLALTEVVNAAYCKLHRLGYQSFIGIKVGVAPWMATYNRILMLEELIRAGFTGWAIYIDADAFFADAKFDLRAYLKTNQSYCLIGGPGEANFDWNINAGIFFLNLGDPSGREIVARWRKMFDEKVPAQYLAETSAKWDDYPNDQWLLHEVIKTDAVLTQRTKKEERGILNYRDGRYIKQAIRAGYHDTHDRLEWLRAETRIALGNMKALPYADLTALANQRGSDKGDAIGNKHGYTQFYQFLFDAFRSEEFDFLELGLLRGGPEIGTDASRAVRDAPSVRMWLDYFPKAYCHGFDISDFSEIRLPRFRFHKGDAGNPADLVRLRAIIRSVRFIIDDASHASYHQQLAFAVLFPMVESGGYHIIEDLDWQPEAYERSLPKRPLTRDVFEGFSRSGMLDLPVNRSDCNTLENMVGSVEFIRRRGDGMIKLVAVRKR